MDAEGLLNLGLLLIFDVNFGDFVSDFASALKFPIACHTYKHRKKIMGCLRINEY